jgi:hypothetical protein
MESCHILHWTLWPSIDHLVPLARGGADDEGNWVTTSTLRNMSKGQATLEELGWRLHPAGRIEDWDGLMGWSGTWSGTRRSLTSSVRCENGSGRPRLSCGQKGVEWP